MKAYLVVAGYPFPRLDPSVYSSPASFSLSVSCVFCLWGEGLGKGEPAGKVASWQALLLRVPSNDWSGVERWCMVVVLM